MAGLSEHQRKMFDRRTREHERLVTGYADVWELWRTRLVGIGGIDVVPPITPDVNIVTLIFDAVTRSGDDVRVHPGRRSRCHENVEDLLSRGGTGDGDPASAGWTGYALSEDGLWRQHSWATTLDGCLIETTTPRLLYTGIPFPWNIPVP